MIRRSVLRLVLLAIVAIPAYVHAHEGHPHKIMGTVSMRHENHLEVKATDGKAAAIILNEKTKILRGKAKVTPDDIKPGERVVVTAIPRKEKDGTTTLTATEIRLAAAK